MKILLPILIVGYWYCNVNYEPPKQYYFQQKIIVDKPIWHDRPWRDSDGGWRPGQSVE